MSSFSDHPAAVAAEPSDAAPVGVVRAMRRGFLCRCPACAKGKLFSRFLKVVPACESCGVAFHHHRADDLPPYLVIFIVGHLIGYGVLTAETRFDVPLAVQMILWPSLALVLSLSLLQPVKGAVVGLQFALGMHGFGADRGRPAENRLARHDQSGVTP